MSDVSSTPVIINLTSPHVEAYKKIRLEALKKNPEAFGSSYEEEVDNHQKFVTRLAQDSPTSFVLGCFEGGILAGIVGFAQERSLKRLHIGGIYSMYVTASARKKGYGKLLVAEVLNRVALVPEIKQLHLQVVSTNVAAIKLYEHFNFKFYGEEKNALKVEDEFHDENLMVLMLSDETNKDTI